MVTKTAQKAAIFIFGAIFGATITAAIFGREKKLTGVTVRRLKHATNELEKRLDQFRADDAELKVRINEYHALKNGKPAPERAKA